MSYQLCPSCGQKTLSVATRCPRCGVAFEAQFFRHQSPDPRPGRIRLALLIAGVLAALMVGSALYQRRSSVPPALPLPVAVQAAPGADTLRGPPADSVGAVAESILPAPSPPASLPSPSPVPAADSTVPAAPIHPAEPADTSAAPRRYARTWTNVRAGRSPAAAVLWILHPGEPVLVDSLVQGWFRVIADGQAAGYADRRFLDSMPPPASP